MAQPVKQNIAELHPELSEKQTYSLVIDGTNLLRLSFADTRINTSGVHYGGGSEARNKVLARIFCGKQCPDWCGGCAEIFG